MPSTSIKSLKRSTVIVLVICCVATLAALLIYDHPAPPDPIYKGQPLSEGLSMVGIRLHGWEWEINGATPSKALQAIGTNALPLIISELRVRDSRLRIWLQETLMENQLDDHWMRPPCVVSAQSGVASMRFTRGEFGFSCSGNRRAFI
jgi:hypothetical protein